MNKIYCEIDTNKVIENLSNIKKLSSEKRIIAVLKSNAYGMGIEGFSKIIDDYIDMYAVSSLDEAESISSQKDILIMSPLCSIDDFSQTNPNVVLSINSLEMAEAINPSVKQRVHLFVDTTNHRMGLKPSEVTRCIDVLNQKNKEVTIEGIYTHLHNTKDKIGTSSQITDFTNTIKMLTYDKYMIHCLSSSAVLSDEYMDLDKLSTHIRVGNLLYGFAGLNKGFKCVHKFKARVLHKVSIKKGEFIGYGADYILAPKDMTIGILECGSFHGFNTSRNTNGFMPNITNAVKTTLRGRSGVCYQNKDISIIGRTNMNSLVIDISHNPAIDVVELKMSPILSDSKITRIYK